MADPASRDARAGCRSRDRRRCGRCRRSAGRCSADLACRHDGVQAAALLWPATVLVGAWSSGCSTVRRSILSRQAAETLRAEADALAAVARMVACGRQRGRSSAGGQRWRAAIPDRGRAQRTARRNLARWPLELSRGGGSGVFRYRRRRAAERLAAGVVVVHRRRRRGWWWRATSRTSASLHRDMRLAVSLRARRAGARRLARPVCCRAARACAASTTMTRTSERIMAGDLTGRVPVSARGDELDRLAAQPQRHARAHRGS